jgi:hypothetical protein
MSGWFVVGSLQFVSRKGDFKILDFATQKLLGGLGNLES